MKRTATENVNLSTAQKNRAGQPVLTRVPKGWTEVKGAMTAPEGYLWISNNKGIFSGERRSAVVKRETYAKAMEKRRTIKPKSIKKPKQVKNGKGK